MALRLSPYRAPPTRTPAGAVPVAQYSHAPVRGAHGGHTIASAIAAASSAGGAAEHPPRAQPNADPALKQAVGTTGGSQTDGASPPQSSRIPRILQPGGNGRSPSRSGSAGRSGEDNRDPRREVLNYRVELEKLQAQNKDLNAKLADSERLHQELEEQVDACKTAATEAEERRRQYEKALEAHMAEMQQLHDQVDALQEQVDAANADVQAEEEQLNGQSAMYSQQLDALRSSATARETELTSQVEKLKANLATVRTEAQSLQHVTQTRSALKNELAKLKQQLVQAKAFNLHQSMVAALKQTRQQTEQLRKMIEHVKTEKAEASKRLATVTAERDKLQRQLAAFASTGSKPSVNGAGRSPAAASRELSVVPAAYHRVPPASSLAIQPLRPTQALPYLLSRPMPSLRHLVANTSPFGCEDLQKQLDAAQVNALNAIAQQVSGSDKPELLEAWASDVFQVLSKLRRAAQDFGAELEQAPPSGAGTALLSAT